AEEYVARALHEALTDDHALPLMPERGLARIRREYRPDRFLDLQHQPVSTIRQIERDGAARPDAAHADDLEGEVDQAITREKHAAVVGKRARIALEDRAKGARELAVLAKAREHRAIFHEAPLSGLQLDQLPDQAVAGALPNPLLE